MTTQFDRQQIFGYLTARGVENDLARKACLLSHYHGKNLKAWHTLKYNEMHRMGFNEREIFILTGQSPEDESKKKKRFLSFFC